MITPIPPLVSIMQACEIAGVSRRTIYNWLKSGKVTFVRTAGGAVRIHAESLFRAESPSTPPVEGTTEWQRLGR